MVRAVRILEALDEHESLTLTELAELLRFPKSTIHQILSTLVAEGLVERQAASNRYLLGLKLFEFGSRARDALEIRRAALPILQGLHGQLDETINLTILERDDVLYIESIESDRRLRTRSAVGDRAPLHCTGVGKAILAFYAPHELARFLDEHRLERFTANTITDAQALRKELTIIARRGYSVDNVEHEEGVRCVAAPIRNAEGSVFAALSISGPSQRVTPALDVDTAKLVVGAAREISARLGYRDCSGRSGGG